MYAAQIESRDLEEDDATREVVSFALGPLEARRLRDALRRARAQGAGSEAAALMWMVDAFQLRAARTR